MAMETEMRVTRLLTPRPRCIRQSAWGSRMAGEGPEAAVSLRQPGAGLGRRAGGCPSSFPGPLFAHQHPPPWLGEGGWLRFLTVKWGLESPRCRATVRVHDAGHVGLQFIWPSLSVQPPVASVPLEERVRGLGVPGS